MKKIAVAISAPTTELSLLAIERLSPHICAAEIRLDLMDEFDLKALISNSSAPLIVTYRPQREGGKYEGPEHQRLKVLKSAIDLGAQYVDIEADSIELFGTTNGFGDTKIIVSKHWFDEMPEGLVETYKILRDKADIVKLIGMAKRTSDVVPILGLLKAADTPVVGLAMGSAGAFSRLINVSFPSCVFTFASASKEAVTAPGQLCVDDLVSDFYLNQIDTQTKWNLVVCGDSLNASFKENTLNISIPAIGEESEVLTELLQKELINMPNLTVS